jgi:hypothetical protein
MRDWIFNSLQGFYVLSTLAQVALLIFSSLEVRSADSPPSEARFYVPLLALTAVTASFNIWRLLDKVLFHRSGTLVSFLISTFALFVILLGYDALVFLYTLYPISGVRIGAQFVSCLRLAYL